jgi:hypothetical protein
VVGGCGTSARSTTGPGIPPALLREARPIGRGPRFQPPVRGPVIGPCRAALGRRVGVHIELFAANRVVIVPRGIGARPPLRLSEGRISAARCYGEVVTLEPTGTVVVPVGSQIALSAVFRSWGQPLSPRRLASFHASPGGRVLVFVNGRRWTGLPGAVPLRPHDEIVLEVGPFVPPHATFNFPPGA